MRSSSAADPAPSPAVPGGPGPADRVRSVLASGFWWLRFPHPLEQEFIAFVRDAQQRTQLALGLVALVLIGAFAAMDFVRYQSVLGTPAAGVFAWGVFLPRWASLAALVLGCALVAVSGNRRLRTAVAVGVFVAVGLSIYVTTAVYSNVGVPNATSSYLLIIVAVFMPCGLLFRESLALGLLLWACALAVVRLLLQPSHAEQAWILMLMMVVALVMSVCSAYMREHGLREQFLLRRLVDWDATHDPLTGLGNRRQWTDGGGAHVRQAERCGVPVALAVLDVDHFKAYNDRYGHQAGDAALCLVARRIAECAHRPLDLAVRLGGEEFALISYGETAASLAGRLAQMQERLRADALPHEASPVAPWLTLSAGVAELRPGLAVAEAFAGAGSVPDQGHGQGVARLEWLHRQADALLYRAKAEGRNRVAWQS